MRCRAAGQWFQSESGLHQNWMRDYDPTTGRYLQADPLGLVDGASVYTYVGNNPVNYLDPVGTNKSRPSRTRRCTPKEREKCRNMCGDRGVESCRVSQTFRITGYRDGGGGMAIYEWKDGPLSCSCNEDPRSCSTLCQVGAIFLGVCLLFTPIPGDEILVPGALIGGGAVMSTQ
ncbi:RHS repeat-associated core domain-containing protein [Aliiroseovarius sp.]|uniref:RHS repeat-associated core domain-containing protein n=1 Tax=Aliiroseovarius sp. TaxID=1872442 RepID=UPI003BA88D3D